ncbi:MAG: galactose-phosphate uridylyltransferase [Pseudomonadota bacterium]|jgi:UDPglucose--hexose-1-phosphate uridylyltransferase
MNTSFDPADHSHRRRNPLTGSWVLVSPHRAKRPWQGRQEAPALAAGPAHDPGCYLCAGNTRVTGERNPDYTGTFVFTNDFAALQQQAPDAPAAEGGVGELFQLQAARGTSRVICFSPDHGRTLAELPVEAVRRVVQTWCAQSAELGERWRWVQVFENKGELMGCSNPHPHGQVWACDFLPNEAAAEDREQRAWHARTGRPLLLDVAAAELARGERVVTANDDWLVVVPYWATWPFETLLLPRFAVQRLPQLSDGQRDSLAAIVRELAARYDNLFECAFPYSMGWHGAPFDVAGSKPADEAPWQLHAHFYPPLLRSASVRKFMVGFEMLAEAQRDLTPEQAAERLRGLSVTHYRQRAAAVGVPA